MRYVATVRAKELPVSQALDLAMSICSGSLHTDNIVHDWHKPLVVGSPETGEIAVFAYNPVLHRMEIEVASQSQEDTISILSFDSFGEMLINDVPLASQGNLEEAVQAAASSAAAAATSASQAASSASTGVGHLGPDRDAGHASFSPRSTRSRRPSTSRWRRLPVGGQRSRPAPRRPAARRPRPALRPARPRPRRRKARPGLPPTSA